MFQGCAIVKLLMSGKERMKIDFFLILETHHYLRKTDELLFISIFISRAVSR
jgi:hypothetical protein